MSFCHAVLDTPMYSPCNRIESLPGVDFAHSPIFTRTPPQYRFSDSLSSGTPYSSDFEEDEDNLFFTSVPQEPDIEDGEVFDPLRGPGYIAQQESEAPEILPSVGIPKTPPLVPIPRPAAPSPQTPYTCVPFIGISKTPPIVKVSRPLAPSPTYPSSISLGSQTPRNSTPPPLVALDMKVNPSLHLFRKPQEKQNIECECGEVCQGLSNIQKNLLSVETELSNMKIEDTLSRQNRDESTEEPAGNVIERNEFVPKPSFLSVWRKYVY